MVGLPVLLLTGGITLMSTGTISLAESVPRVMGSAQARISVPGIVNLVQSPDGQNTTSSMTERKAPPGDQSSGVPGLPGAPVPTVNTVEKVTGGRVIRTVSTSVRVTLGDRRPSMPLLGIDGRDPLARGMTTLVTGRWSGAPSEVVVTEAGISHGLPSRGKLTINGPDGKPRLLAVVGVATGHTEHEIPDLVALPALVDNVPDLEGMTMGAFLLERGTPVTWAEVRRMNKAGLLVQSRQVFLNPPALTELDAQIRQGVGADQRQMDLILLLAGAGLFIETTLLAGPAFAVSATRQRRSLALAASNGAEARQLRRYVLGQAVVLGVASAAVAVVAGLLLTAAGVSWWQAGHPDADLGPFDVSWPRVAGVFICAVVASVVAALLPARGIGRLDIVSVLSGRSGEHTVRRGLPVAGVLVMVLSGAAIFWSVTSGPESGIVLSEVLVVGGAISLVLGCLMVIPALLALVGRLGTHLALPLRLAARDTARQRGRSTPAVAAIMAAVGALTALSISATSNNRQQEDLYEASRPMGTGTVTLNGEDAKERSVRAVTDRFAPRLTVDTIGYVYDASASQPRKGGVTWVLPVPPFCTDARILALRRSNDGVGECAALAGASEPQVGGLAGLMRRLPLSASQRAALAGGGVLVTDPRMVKDGHVSFIGGTATQGGLATGKPGTGDPTSVITQRTRVPAGLVSQSDWAAAFDSGPSGAWILPETAARLGWPVRNTSLELTSPTGTISPEEESAVADRLGDQYLVYVERGYQNTSWLILLILFSVAGLLVVIASLISTALSLAESQTDMATLAAVGATRRTRRGVAGSQALVVAAVGCLLGVAVGMVPGIASTRPLTVRYLSAAGTSVGARPLDASALQVGPVIEIPWLPLLALVVLVPLLAAGLAWVAVRRHPQMTRRLV
jgi:putative ABC transport system permease protein